MCQGVTTSFLDTECIPKPSYWLLSPPWDIHLCLPSRHQTQAAPSPVAACGSIHAALPVWKPGSFQPGDRLRVYTTNPRMPNYISSETLDVPANPLETSRLLVTKKTIISRILASDFIFLTLGIPVCQSKSQQNTAKMWWNEMTF